MKDKSPNEGDEAFTNSRSLHTENAGENGGGVSTLVASSNRYDDDANLAIILNSLETLTTVFGFERRLAEKALEAIDDKSDVTAAYNWILDNGGTDSGGPVTPIDSCPHVSKRVHLSAEQVPVGIFQLPCSFFEDEKDAHTLSKETSCPSKENWLCLECGAVRCSRYINGHGLEHWQNSRFEGENRKSSHAGKGYSDGDEARSGHCVAVSLSDLSVWCHICEAYLKDESLKPILAQLERIKFG